jgi:predicted naringenin-chalcone synthase
MSSGTVFFVLQAMLQTGRTGDKIVLMAFGPGLTVELALLEVA